jgi:hypothetical protein
MIGTKRETEAADGEGESPLAVVGERSTLGRRRTARTAGRCGSDDPDMSSDKRCEKQRRRKPKVSWGR